MQNTKQKHTIMPISKAQDVSQSLNYAHRVLGHDDRDSLFDLEDAAIHKMRAYQVDSLFDLEDAAIHKMGADQVQNAKFEESIDVQGTTDNGPHIDALPAYFGSRGTTNDMGYVTLHAYKLRDPTGRFHLSRRFLLRCVDKFMDTEPRYMADNILSLQSHPRWFQVLWISLLVWWFVPMFYVCNAIMFLMSVLVCLPIFLLCDLVAYVNGPNLDCIHNRDTQIYEREHYQIQSNTHCLSLLCRCLETDEDRPVTHNDHITTIVSPPLPGP
jgi:hypothetical protein